MGKKRGRLGNSFPAHALATVGLFFLLVPESHCQCIVVYLFLRILTMASTRTQPTTTEAELKNHSFTIKEGVEYRLKVLFK